MIFISQGHQHSIGLEIFLKAISLLNERDRKLFCLVGFESSMDETHKSITTELNLSGLTFLRLEPSNNTESRQSLEYCLDKVTSRDILITLPTSKNQFPGDGGHSRFFRQRYKNNHISMVFEFLDDRMLLITDHIPLGEIPRTVDAPLIVSKTKITLKGYASMGVHIKEVFFSGINPHAGEGGLLGKEDPVVAQSANKLEKEFPHIRFSGPLSADSLHFHKKSHLDQLFVYMYHDQGLPKFKSEHGTLGIHLTFGLPFLRMSVDHGTAFGLYKKDCADYMGMYHLLNRALECH